MRAYEDMVFSTAARITGNDAQAEDIAQEVFLRAYGQFEQLLEGGTAGGWLKTVATHLALNYVSRYRRRWRFFSELRANRDEDDDDTPDPQFPAPETLFTEVDAGKRRALVEEALRALPDHQRVPLVLFHFEDMPYDEIAARLGVSLAKVKTDIHRGRLALAKALTRAGLAAETLDI